MKDLEVPRAYLGLRIPSNAGNVENPATMHEIAEALQLLVKVRGRLDLDRATIVRHVTQDKPCQSTDTRHDGCGTVCTATTWRWEQKWTVSRYG